jgi:hypothetical protein
MHETHVFLYVYQLKALTFIDQICFLRSVTKTRRYNAEFHISLETYRHTTRLAVTARLCNLKGVFLLLYIAYHIKLTLYAILEHS